MKELIQFALCSLLAAIHSDPLLAQESDLRGSTVSKGTGDCTVSTISLDQIGALVEKQYSGNGLSVVAAPD